MLKLKRLVAVLCGLIIISSTSVSAEQSITVKLDGENVEFSDAKPVVKDNRTLIPLRGLFENMGYEITWDAKLKAATLSKDGNTITIRSNKNYITVNNIQTTIDVAAEIIDGSMMIPLRAVADATGAEVNWDSSTRTVEIITDSTINYVVNMNDYSEAYNELIEPLSLLEDVAAGLNSLNSNGSSENIASVSSQIDNAAAVITSVRNKVSKLEPTDNFAEFHNLALEAMDKQLELCDLLKSALSGRIDYAKARVDIEELLLQAQDINNRMNSISFNFG